MFLRCLGTEAASLALHLPHHFVIQRKGGEGQGPEHGAGFVDDCSGEAPSQILLIKTWAVEPVCLTSHPFIARHVSCSQFLAIIDKVAMNIHAQVFV